MPAKVRDCPICGGVTEPRFTARLRGEIDARFLQCRSCRFLFAEDPFWLEAAHADALNASDTGLVRRNLAAARRIAALVLLCLDRRGTFLDEAGGTGLLVRLLRDRGLDFRWRDRYATNVFARGFEAPDDGRRYEAITWLECAEHVPDPAATIDALLRETDTLILTTQLLPSPTPMPDDWWYYGWNHGQHVSFYTRRTFDALATRLGARCVSDGRAWHVLSRRTISPLRLRLALRLARPIDALLGRALLRPLTESDHRSLAAAP